MAATFSSRKDSTNSKEYTPRMCGAVAREGERLRGDCFRFVYACASVCVTYVLCKLRTPCTETQNVPFKTQNESDPV